MIEYMTVDKLLKDIENTKEGSIEEKVCIDIFMNIYEYIGYYKLYPSIPWTHN